MYPWFPVHCFEQTNCSIYVIWLTDKSFLYWDYPSRTSSCCLVLHLQGLPIAYRIKCTCGYTRLSVIWPWINFISSSFTWHKLFSPDTGNFLIFPWTQDKIHYFLFSHPSCLSDAISFTSFLLSSPSFLPLLKCCSCFWCWNRTQGPGCAR